MESKDEKYWTDYTDFIKDVENLTGLNPSNLLSQYQSLIADLRYIDEDYYLEFPYEFNYDLRVRQQIQDIIDHKQISENILLKEFKEEIKKLDSELKKYLLIPDKTDWWNSPKINFKDRQSGNK